MIPGELRGRAQWLVWRYEPGEAGKKPRKMPYYADGSRRVGKQGTAADRAKLTTHEHALAMQARREMTGLGFAFLPDDGLIGIDLDNAVDTDTGEIAAWATEIVQRCASYTEWSPSHRGLHIYVKGRTKSTKSNDIGVEVFCGSQFFTVTGEHFPGSPETVNEIPAEALAWLVAMVEEAKGRRKAPAGSSSSAGAGGLPAATASRGGASPAAGASFPSAGDDAARAESALAMVRADDYQTWIDVGLALKHGLGDAGYAVWDRWSSRSSKYAGADDTRKRWAGFQPSGAVTLGTVFALAQQAGWRPPRAPSTSRARAVAAPGDAAGGGDAESPPPPDDVPPPDAPSAGGEPRPLIQWVNGELPRIVDEAEAALLSSGTQLYQRAGTIVRVVRRESPTVRNYKRPPGALGLVRVDLPYLVETMTRVADWEKYDGKAKDWVRTNAPEKVAQTYLSRVGSWKLPALRAVISTPTLRPDGTLVQRPGYDAATQTFYDPCGTEFPEIPDHPTEEAGRAELERLQKAFATFPFAAEVDQSVALAMALTSLVRRSLPSAPLGGITAPVMGSGKTLMADLIAILATGTAAPAMKFAETDEEAAKTALSVLIEGDAVVLIDNIERPLQGDWLCTLLTSETYSQRELGKNQMVKVPTATLFLATGNQLVIAGDLRTRALLCRLDPKVEKPEEREFKHDAREWFMAHRPQLVAAGLTVMRAYIAAGSPADVPTWGRFEHWSRMVREPLVWLGMQDPLVSLRAIAEDDPDRQQHLQVMEAWTQLFGDKPKTAREALEVCKSPAVTPEEASLSEVLRDISVGRQGLVDSKRLGKWLQRHVNRRAEGLMFVKAGEHDHAVRWKVEKVRAVD